MIPKSLLLINGDNDFNTLVKFVLRYDTNWNIFTALNGKEGISKAQVYQPDVILLDTSMPKHDGLTVYSLLKSNWTTCAIPVIFLTAMVGMKKIITLRITENAELITKPFNIVKLKNEVIKLYDQYSTLRH
ncbi:response regulator [Pleurocapsa sp. PCC 7319]|uniref:response regulator n=1 Tax=Pleurocapsa sp. PCC 7319 TaxID=118161 RepID=UPI00035ED5A6|nr:response regulator [Pleurocapsa sp. PCC 7319]